MLAKNWFKPAASVVMVMLINGCSGGGEGEDDYQSSSGSALQTSCNYPDLIGATTRAQANSCGTQVSTQIAAVDMRLSTIIKACQMGYKSKADIDYNSTYKTAVAEALAVMKGFSCGNPSTGVPLTPVTQNYYNLCTNVFMQTISYSCYGPVPSSNYNCSSGNDGGYNFIQRYTTRDKCMTAGSQWRP